MLRTAWLFGKLTAVTCVLAIVCLLSCTATATAQPALAEQDAIEDLPAAPTPPDTDSVPETVEVEPEAEDEAIARRLTRILEATGWYQSPTVRVDEGVVFLSGLVYSDDHKEWAGKLAGNTSDVVAVVNRMKVKQRSVWSLSPIWYELRALANAIFRGIPQLLVGIAMLSMTWLIGRGSASATRALLRRRVTSDLLRQVAAQAVAIPVFLLGAYLILRVFGLTRLAVTVLGGTGLMGLIIGFAFRDIAENFLASILISVQHPFARGDLIEVSEFTGYVQRVNTRSTLLMTLDGNHLQIPNAIIYKQTIINFTSNPNLRIHFEIGIGYDSSISDAQSVALAVLRDHPAVQNEPESLVLVDALGAATVKLSVLFWVNIENHSQYKVKSAVIRQTKQAFERAGISMPDEAREVVFPSGVPVQMVSPAEASYPAQRPHEGGGDESDAHNAEGNLDSEASDIREQADHARLPEGGQSLL